MSNFDKPDDIHFPTITDLYQRSKINLEEFYESCVLISYKTSNTQTEIEKMPFWKVNNIIIGLEKIIKSENGDSKENNNNNNQNEENPYMKQAQQMFNQAKSSLPKSGTPKVPKLPSFKLH